MRLNRGMRLPLWARAAPLVLMAAAVLLAACGRSGYQYVDNDDETVFIKIPEDWDVVSEGAVNFTLTPDDNIQPIPGELVLPWRAAFDAAPTGERGSLDYVQGHVEVQPVDRRVQDNLNIDFFFPELSSNAGGVEDVRRYLVTVGDVSGERIKWKQVTESGTEFMRDRLVLKNSINSVVYRVDVVCSLGCYQANANSIEEVMSTFTVED